MRGGEGGVRGLGLGEGGGYEGLGRWWTRRLLVWGHAPGGVSGGSGSLRLRDGEAYMGGTRDFFAYGHFGGYITASSWRAFVEFVMGGCQDRGPAGGWVRRGLDSCRREAFGFGWTGLDRAPKISALRSSQVPRCSAQYRNGSQCANSPRTPEYSVYNVVITHVWVQAGVRTRLRGTPTEPMHSAALSG